MKRSPEIFLSVASLTCILALLFWPVGAQGDQSNTVDLSVGASVDPTLQISVSGGNNQFGKRTIFSGTGMDFGPVTFTNPQAITNGDAYMRGGSLMLEAVFDVGIIFNGVQSVDVDLSKIFGSPRSFKEVYYTLSVNRADTQLPIYTEPRTNRLATLTTPATLTLMLTFEISPQQGGQMSDRFRIIATSF